MKILISILLILLTQSAFATIGILAGGISSSIDTKSYLSSSNLTSNPSQTCFEGGIFYEHDFNAVLGLRVGIESYQIAWGAGFSGGYSYTFTMNTISVPVFLNLHFGPIFSLLLGGQYWTLNSTSWTQTNMTLNATNLSGSGINPRGGIALSFGPHFEVSASYLPSFQVVPASNGNPTMTVTQYALDVAYKF